MTFCYGEDLSPKQISDNLSNSIPEKMRIAVMPFNGEPKELATFYEDEISSNLIAESKFTLLTIKERDLIKNEITYQLSGLVDDESIVAIGHQLGVQVIIVGNISIIEKSYNLTIKAVNVETAQYHFYKTYQIPKSKVTEYSNKENNSNDNKKASTDFHFSVEPVVSFRTGTIGEYVFLKNSSYSSNKLSELDWDMKPIFAVGIRANGGWKGIGVTGYVSGAVSSKCGTMADSDWLNVQYSELSNYQYKTNYSESDNYVDSCINAGVQAGYTFNLPYHFSITPFAAFDFEHIAFTAKGGNAWYGTQSNSTYYYPYNDASHQYTYNWDDDEKVIGYERYTYIPWIGLSAGYKFDFGLSLSASFQTAPYVYCESQDDHYLTGNVYVDACSDNFCAFKYAFSASYRINRWNTVNLDISYFLLNTITGKSYQKVNNTYVLLSEQDGGADEQYFSAGLSWKITILE